MSSIGRVYQRRREQASKSKSIWNHGACSRNYASKLAESKFLFMKNLFFLFLIFLVSCSAPQPATQVFEATSTFTLEPSITPTFTSIPATATIPPTIVPTDTPIPCDPHLVDFCITDGHFLFQRPIQPPNYDSVDPTYRYASTANGKRDPHHGVEIGKDYGTPVEAAADGVILFAGPDDVPVFSPWAIFYGNMIVIQHDDGLFTVYGHLSKIIVRQGQAVKMGEPIGEVGQSGAATGSHLHFEVRMGDVKDYFSTQNPELWMMPKAGCGALMIAVVDGNNKFQRSKLTIEQYSDANDVLSAYYLDTYDPKMAVGIENAGMGDLPAGRYRITLIYNGHLYERWVDVQSSRLTQVVMVVN